MHLVVDGMTEKRMSITEVENILYELPSRINMHILAGPFVVEGEPTNPGCTGFVIIDKSHISIHTFDEGQLISIDVFSCKLFDADLAMQYLEDKINLSKINSQILTRSERS
jgi:S-adenosylmethionine decarboxylase